MDTSKEDDEFKRIRLTAVVERARQVVAMYEQNQEHFRQAIENNRYELGKLDERLRG